MSTRGAYGFRKNGVDKITYNHFDSYPSGLGADFARFCARVGAEGLNRLCDEATLVQSRATPTKEQIEECVKAGYFDESVGDRSEKDWYCLLRGLMGNFDEYERLAETGERLYMIDDADFLKDSLFCEYAYVANLDEGVLEFWTGFQKKPQNGNRYGEKPEDNGYYPCRLSAVFPLDSLTVAGVKKTVAEMEKATEEETSDAEDGTDAGDFRKLAEEAGLTAEETAEAEELFSKTPEGVPENPTAVSCWKNAREFAAETVEDVYGSLNGLIGYVDLDRFAEDLMKEGRRVVLKSGKVVECG